MTSKKPLIIIIWTCQEMMAWVMAFRVRVRVILSHTLTTNLTEHDSHGPDDQPKTMMAWMSMELIGSMDVICHVIRSEVGQTTAHS
jgi:hypothetical protein